MVGPGALSSPPFPISANSVPPPSLLTSAATPASALSLSPHDGNVEGMGAGAPGAPLSSAHYPSRCHRCLSSSCAFLIGLAARSHNPPSPPPFGSHQLPHKHSQERSFAYASKLSLSPTPPCLPDTGASPSLLSLSLAACRLRPYSAGCFHPKLPPPFDAASCTP